MRRRLLVSVVLALAQQALAADAPLGRLFFTPEERAALEDARKRNIRAEELAAAASKRPPAPRSRNVTVSGVILRSDGQSFAWVNGKGVEGQTKDGLRVRHTAQANKVLVYDADKGRMVQVKVGQRADLVTGRVEEGYERRTREPAEAESAQAPAAEGSSVPSAGPDQIRREEQSRPSRRNAQARSAAHSSQDTDPAREN